MTPNPITPDTPPIVYLNGEFLPLPAAKISVMDRGFLFGDGIYEVIPVYQSKLFHAAEHLARLADSLREIRLVLPNPIDWIPLFETLIEKNGGGTLSIYLQITRGAPLTRYHGFPTETTPTVFLRTMPFQPPSLAVLQKGFHAITHPDIRWRYCHIKSISLLANVLLFQQALEAQAEDVILISETGYVAECATSNVFIVKNGVVMTPPKSPAILGGITRDFVIALTTAQHIPVKEDPISVADLFQADEVWVTSSTREIKPIIRLDDKPIGTGQPGQYWEKMIHCYREAIA